MKPSRLISQMLPAGLLILSLALPAWADTPKTPDPAREKAPANAQALHDRFVTFKPNFPLMPGCLDLFGYEREKVARSFPILSPDRSQMVVTDVLFMPELKQTYSRVYLYPVGRRPTLNDLLTPEAKERLAEQTQKEKAKNPAYIPQVALTDVDPHGFWDQYSPDKQIAFRESLMEVGFGNYKPYRADILHVADWSQDGNRLLILYKPGIHHLGVYKTIPAVYTLPTREAVQYTHLPGLIWSDFLARFPEQAQPTGRVWDIRPLGWSSANPQAMIVKLVLFEGQSELAAGYWAYSIQTGELTCLGDTIESSLVARNGWLVSFVDPTAPGGPQVYAPGQAPPTPQDRQAQAEQAAKDRKLWKRIQFWKKQPGSPAQQ